jgi:hypothetical protein
MSEKRVLRTIEPWSPITVDQIKSVIPSGLNVEYVEENGVVRILADADKVNDLNEWLKAWGV